MFGRIITSRIDVAGSIPNRLYYLGDQFMSNPIRTVANISDLSNLNDYTITYGKSTTKYLNNGIQLPSISASNWILFAWAYINSLCVSCIFSKSIAHGSFVPYNFSPDVVRCVSITLYGTSYRFVPKYFKISTGENDVDTNITVEHVEYYLMAS